jgi:peptidoglycan/xylan/chitin deacetylase (PgdA/CDA1 family)
MAMDRRTRASYRHGALAVAAALAGLVLYVLRLPAWPGIPRAAAEPIRWVETQRRWVALTFDGTPSRKWTPVLLRLLRAYGAQATFFPLGKSLSWAQDLVRAMVAEGHEVGAAPYAGEPMVGSPEVLGRRVWAASVRLDALTGGRAFLFRPTAGGNLPALTLAAAAHGERVVLWNVDAGDDRGWSPAQVAAHVLHYLRPGSIVRMRMGPTAAQTLGLLLPRLKVLGYRCVTVSELLGGGIPQPPEEGEAFSLFGRLVAPG